MMYLPRTMDDFYMQARASHEKVVVTEVLDFIEQVRPRAGRKLWFEVVAKPLMDKAMKEVLSVQQPKRRN